MLKTVKTDKSLRSPEPHTAMEQSVARPVKPFDADVLHKLIIEYGEDKVAKLIELFKASAPGSIADMWRALEKSDAAGLFRAAHKLKGSCLHFGATPLRDLCAQLEQAGLSGNMDGTADLVVSAEKELDRVLEALKADNKSKLPT
jgi:HPt (histidine-containing phosphotransfer) domain-containing protein